MTDFSPLNFPLPERTGAEGLDARVTALEETIVRLLEARFSGIIIVLSMCMCVSM